MRPRIALSAASQRTSSPAISSLMRLAFDNPDTVSLAAGFVDQATLPVEATSKAVAAILASVDEGRRALQYGTTQGDPGLRKSLISLLEESERVAPGTYSEFLPRTVVTTGSQQLLYLLAEALVDPGDIVLVESPTYFVFIGVLESRGARIFGVETDDGGLKIDSLEETLARLDEEGQLPRVKMIYTVSEHSNPSGLTLAANRRKPLVETARKWSRDHRIYVLEDSAYRGLTYDGTEPPSVWSEDAEGDSVILARTFSKTFSPGLKIGYGVLPEALVDPVLRLKGNHDFGSANFNQIVIEHLIQTGAYHRQIEVLVDRYRKKRDVMRDALDEYLGPLDCVSWTRPSGGLYFWLTFPDEIDTGGQGPLFKRCLKTGVLYVPGEHAFGESFNATPTTNHARLCFGVPNEERLVEGVRRLSQAVIECLDSVASNSSG